MFHFIRFLYYSPLLMLQQEMSTEKKEEMILKTEDEPGKN